MLGGIEWTALPLAGEILGVTDMELLIMHLLAIRRHLDAKASG